MPLLVTVQLKLLYPTIKKILASIRAWLLRIMLNWYRLPTPKREKGHVYIKSFLGVVSEFRLGRAKQICAMWLNSDYRVTPHYNIIANYCSAWEQLMHCHAMPKWCIVMMITWHTTYCAPPGKALIVAIPGPFSVLVLRNYDIEMEFLASPTMAWHALHSSGQ